MPLRNLLTDISFSFKSHLKDFLNFHRVAWFDLENISMFSDHTVPWMFTFISAFPSCLFGEAGLIIGQGDFQIGASVNFPAVGQVQP